MHSLIRHLGLGLALLGASGTASAQQAAPPNIHFLLDTSGSMRELPQISGSMHSAFFNETTSGCFNSKLDTMAVSRGWNPDTVYPVVDAGTGLGSDSGFSNLFQDDKFYAYMYWNDSSNPTSQWDSKEQACQSQVANWSTTGASDYNRCLSCLSLKGYWKRPGAVGRDSAPLTNLDFIFWGRFLNFNPPKYATAKAVLKSVLKDLQNTRAGISIFTGSGYLSSMIEPQAPSCSVILSDPTGAFSSYRAGYIDAVNALTFTTATPLAKSLLNVGYYFTSDSSVYQTTFNFGTNYNYPPEYANDPLTSDNRSVCWGCQVNAVVILTDGDPSSDTITSTMASRLRTVNGGPVYCPDAQPCNSGTSNSTRDKGTSDTNTADDNPNYYLDDVAKMLYTQDLQTSTPSQVGDFDTAGAQSVITYTVGFGINSNLLKNTAAVGGGLSFSATNGTDLKQALQTIVSDVQTRSASCIYYPAP